MMYGSEFAYLSAQTQGGGGGGRRSETVNKVEEKTNLHRSQYNMPAFISKLWLDWISSDVETMYILKTLNVILAAAERVQSLLNSFKNDFDIYK